MKLMRWLVTTDLDGTLLDDTYPEAAALDALRTLYAADPSAERIWVALASSKTFAEMLHMVHPLGRNGRRPFLIFENGGGLAWPAEWSSYLGRCSLHGYEVANFGASYAEVCEVLATLAAEGYRFRGFSQMSAQQVSELTGLSQEQALRAQRRLTSEPLEWLGTQTELERFTDRLGAWGLTVVRGGRFYHVTSGSDKQHAVAHLLKQFATEFSAKPQVLACGDAPNDLEMIRSADRAVIFPRSGSYLCAANDKYSHAAQPGPDAWLQSVQQALALPALA